LPIRLHPPVITCFLELESSNLNDLELIAFCLARGRARGSSGNPRGRRHHTAGGRLRRQPKGESAADSLRIAQSEILYAN
jgi:hypothetical protein